MPSKILLIDDEKPILRFLNVLLSSHDYQIFEAQTGQEGLRLAAIEQPDLILLDIGLPDMDGFTLLGHLREWSSIPVMIISARQGEMEKVRALDLGADDYLTKPFGSSELLARIRVIFRRLKQQYNRPEDLSEQELNIGEIRVDPVARLVHRGDSLIHLTPIEYKMLLLLMRNAGKILTHRQILAEIWGANYVEHAQYVRVYMGQLRQKIESDPANPDYIFTETGVGYRFTTTLEPQC
ncbi:response regulator [Dongshaea marina]|uniref:response regulator n=1 Tax=Dongshaea marina TaxID=2047966 RepID=UPI001901429D|nr:response regulator [Dongshaea marina]